MAFATVPGIFILLLYLKNVDGQQGTMNNLNMGFNGPPGPTPPQPNVPNFNNFNQVPINPAGTPNMPQLNISPQVNVQPTNTFQGSKQVTLQPPTKTGINGQQPFNSQQNNLPKPNTAPAANLQMPRQPNQILTNDMNLPQLTKGTGFPLQPSPVPLQITSFNFIPVDQMPFNPQNQLPYVPNQPTFKAQILPPSLQTIVNFAAQNSMTPLQEEQALLQNSLLSLQNSLNPMNPFIAQPSFGPIQNQPIFTGIPNQLPFNSFSPGVFALPSSYNPNQQGMIPVQGQPIPFLSTQDQQPIQVQPVVTYQDQPVNPFQGSATYIPLTSQYGPNIPIYTQIPAYNPQPKSNKSSGLKAILPYLINLLQERQKCPCPNCGCMSNDQDPQIFGGYANQKSYGTLPNDQNLPVVNIDMDDLQTNTRFLREHPSKNVINTESEELSDEDSIEVADDGDDTSDSD